MENFFPLDYFHQLKRLIHIELNNTPKCVFFFPHDESINSFCWEELFLGLS
jgi:hypothetical protein